MNTVLVTGGAGFIGAHTVRALTDAGLNPIVFDNLENGHADTCTNVPFIRGDIRSINDLNRAFKAHDIDSVIHFAAYTEAGESMSNPLKFYENNSAGVINLIRAMVAGGVADLVFSSTAAVYGQPVGQAALHETSPKAPINPYGQSKWLSENIIKDCAAAHSIKAVALRYFNAAGCHPDGSLGERHDPETHLIPLVLQTALGQREHIKIFGTDYPTPDGTCIRDYIHVCDLADAHIKALRYIKEQKHTSGFFDAFNLGTGQGFSVRQVINQSKDITGIDFKVVEAEKRPGDPAILVADPARAHQVLNWTARMPKLSDMITHAWNYMQQAHKKVPLP